MKHLYSLVFMLIALNGSNLCSAQNVITTNSTGISTCDGTAFNNAHSWMYGSGMWTWRWYQDTTQIAGEDSLITNLCPGNYSLVFDSMGIVVNTEYFTIGNICSGFTHGVTQINCTPGICNGSLTFLPYGGTAPYTYIWSTGTTTQSISNLCPGVYSVTCTDSYGCSQTVSFTIIEEVLPPLQAALGINDDYYSNCTGDATVFIAGGNPPYSIYWTTGETSNYTDSLCPGVYSVYVTDAANIDTVIISFVIADSSSIYGSGPNSPVNDTLYTELVTNCTIDYSIIDSASLYLAVYDSINQNLYVTWAIYTPTDTTYISDTLGLAGNPGFYILTISVYCPNKSGNDFFKINGAVYFDGSGISTLQVSDNPLGNISIYPNPFSSSISVDNKNGAIRSVKLIDLNGRIISELGQVNPGLVELNQLESVSSGTYLLILSGESASKTYKVIK